MNVNKKFFFFFLGGGGILLITVHIFKMFWQLELQSSNGMTNPCRVVNSSWLLAKIATYLVGISLWMAFFKISLDWSLTLTTLPLAFGYQCKHFRTLKFVCFFNTKDNYFKIFFLASNHVTPEEKDKVRELNLLVICVS